VFIGREVETFLWNAGTYVPKLYGVTSQLRIKSFLCFNVHRAVHHNIASVVKPTRGTSLSNYFILDWNSTCFGRSFRPSSGVRDCTYSNRHMSNRYYYLQADIQQTVHTATGICQTDNAICKQTVHYCYLQADIQQTVHTATGICQTDTAICKQSAVSVWHLPVAVCAVLNSWWWTERPSETCRVSFQNKINLIHWCIWLI